jgi:hypothetical protein
MLKKDSIEPCATKHTGVVEGEVEEGPFFFLLFLQACTYWFDLVVYVSITL